MNSTLLISILEQGMIYAIMSFGVYITYKILDFPDLTVDGSFPLGAAVTIILIQKGMNPYLTLLISLLAGAAAGIITGLIHVKLRVRDLLSGIIMMTALYTINLRIPGTSYSNISRSLATIFENDFISGIIPKGLLPYKKLIVILVIMLISKIALDLYLKTKSGFLLRAVGDNEVLVTSLGKDKGIVKIIGLAIANGLVALGGSVMCQQQNYYNISMGTGAIVIGLASVIIGTGLIRKNKYLKQTTLVVGGAILYRACVAIAIRQFEAIDMKLITAILFLVILVISMERDRKKKVKT